MLPLVVTRGGHNFPFNAIATQITMTVFRNQSAQNVVPKNDEYVLIKGERSLL